MVLGGFDLEIDEDRLRALTDCTPLGTEAFQVIEAARQLGFTASRKYTLSSIDELARLLDDGLFPIVYVDLWPIRGGQSGQFHSLVVVRVERESVTVLDPLVGESNLIRDDFQEAWAEMRFLTILIANK
jgi:ABC-type bacteriocin/lantibiotic exporter with double-glycine peptidase domain